MDALIYSSGYADGPQYQTPTMSFRHGMRGPGETVGGNMQRTENFIQGQVRYAQQLQGGPVRNSRDINEDSLNAFGLAAHAEMDKTSPAHRDSRGIPFEWNEDSSMRDHMWTELYSNQEQFDRTVGALRRLYARTYGQDALRQAMIRPRRGPWIGWGVGWDE